MRKEVQNQLQKVTNNVFQDYPNTDKDYPCLVWSLSNEGRASHDGVAFYRQFLRVEIFALQSNERTDLEIKLIETLLVEGWINRSNNELPHPDYYRQNLTFERKE
ncbi:hypothetical protein G7059_07915 [Erysipelothrix sp. HDW6A]|uniref:hypothetical protein n=1 Tax=Erysipelothrix sp. HDW6A TaxID=2714928 RepID=UPI00140E06FD|nr:hypothetical protein [Erysipelothrix sp. HDW6A]QIK57769.1 hypothetical protein G7059_07915 [Erysipelothrix sp. HDW6A]